MKKIVKPQSKTEVNDKDPGGMVYSLPSEKSKPLGSIDQLTALIYGERKIGKTSLTSMFKDNLNMMFEPGGKFLSLRKVEIGTWNDGLGYLMSIMKSDISTITIDTADAAFEMLCKWSTIQYSTDGDRYRHINEVPYGKGTDLAATEFRDRFRPLMARKSVFFLSHIGWGEFNSPDGTKKNRYFPTLHWKANQWLSGAVDMLACYTYMGDKRVLVIEGNESVEAGHRCDGAFMTPGGERVKVIPMGTTYEESYRNFMNAFNNEQRDPGIVTDPEIVGEILKAKAKESR